MDVTCTLKSLHSIEISQIARNKRLERYAHKDSTADLGGGMDAEEGKVIGKSHHRNGRDQRIRQEAGFRSAH